MPAIPQIVSADDHLVEPPHLWTSRLPKRARDTGPRVVRERGRLATREGEITIDSSDDSDAMWMDVWHYESVRHVITQASIAVGIPRDEIRAGQPVLYEEMRPGLTQPTFRLADMDVAGIEASLCFPNTFVRFCGQRFLWGRDKELAAMCVEAYNDFVIEEWADGAGGRLIPCAITPLWDPMLAAAEVRRVAARGVRAVAFSELPPYLGLPSIYTNHWDPFFAACEQSHVVIMVHVGSSSQLPCTSDDAPLAVIHALPSNNSAAALVDWLCAALPVRFPGLRLCLAESNIGWIPYFLERLDTIWDHNRAYTGIRERLPNPPSSYFASNVYCTFFSDAFGLRSLDAIGVDNVMFETDYPHGDSTWPDCLDVAREQTAAAGLTREVVEKVIRGNARQLFDLDRLSS